MKNPVKFGKYYLLDRISVGGMAEVFKAKSFGEAGFERLVAVKRILPSIAEDNEFIAMFVDEAKLAVQLTHPNIAQIFELGKVGDAYFIALEYVAGKDMRAIFDRTRRGNQPIPMPMACYVVMKLCEGLDYAHNKKDAAGRALELVHRDVSPQNIIVSYDGDVKLIDFGIAKAASKSSKTQAGILKGKFGYMSPEQVRGLQVDRRSDVFAVGICLYELLTGERLFVGESDFSTLEKVRNVEIMPPSTYNRKIPEELEAIVLRALAKHPEDRYRTAMDLHDDLQSFMYTSGNFFARKDLSAYVHKIFSEEISREAQRDEEFRRFDSRRANDLEALESAAAPAPAHPVSVGRGAPPLPPAARASAPPPPPPPGPRSNRSTVMGVGSSGVSAAAAAARPTPAPRTPPPPAPVALAAAPEMDMDWDEEELATQVYDKPDQLTRAIPSSPPPPAARGGSPASRNHAAASAPKANGMPAVPALPSLPGARPSMSTSLGLGVAAPMVSSSLQAVSGPAVGAPAVPAPPPPAPPPVAQPAAAAPPPLRSVSGPSPAASQSAAFASAGDAFAPARPPPGANTSGNYRLGAQPQPSAGPRARSKDNSSQLLLAGLGVIAVAAVVVIGLKLTRGEPTGGLAITTNVGGVTVEIDSQPQIGNGQSFSVTELSAERSHRVIVRKPGFRTFQQDVPVRSGAITPMQVVLEPEAAVALPPPAAPEPASPLVAQNTEPAPAVQQLAPESPPEAAPPAAPPAPPASAAAVEAPAAPRPRPAAQPRVAVSPAVRPRPIQRPVAQPETPRPAAASTASSGENGTLLLSTRPSSVCTIAGRPSFSTPRRVPLPPGNYRVSCVNEDLNMRGNFTFTIAAGESVSMLNRSLE